MSYVITPEVLILLSAIIIPSHFDLQALNPFKDELLEIDNVALFSINIPEKESALAPNSRDFDSIE